MLWLAFMEFVQAVGMNMNERGTSVDWLLVWVFLLAIPFNFVLSLLAWKARSMEAQCLFKDEQPT